MGEAAITTGVLGLGKLISSCRTNSSEIFDVGYARPYGEDSVVEYANANCSCELTGTAP